MSIERRRPEAGSLRQLFQDQWRHICRLAGMSGPDADRPDPAHQALDALVTATNPRLKLLSDYRTRLRGGVGMLLAHVSGLVAALPAPVEVDPEHFHAHPGTGAFFVNKHDVRHAFSRSHELQAYFDDPARAAQDAAYAVLFMRKVEKNVLGGEVIGDVMFRDVEKLSIYFTGHLVKLPQPDEPALRSALERYLFERVVDYIKLRIARPRNGDPSPSSLQDPERYLDRLVEILGTPMDLLRLETNTMFVDGMGFRVAGPALSAAPEITLHEIELAGRHRQVITLVSYRRDQMHSRAKLLRDASLALDAGHRG